MAKVEDCPAYFIALQSANNHRHFLTFVKHNAGNKHTHYHFINENVARVLSPSFGETVNSLDSLEAPIITRINDAEAILFDDHASDVVKQKIPLSDQGMLSKPFFVRSIPLTHLVIVSSRQECQRRQGRVRLALRAPHGVGHTIHDNLQRLG